MTNIFQQPAWRIRFGHSNWTAAGMFVIGTFASVPIAYSAQVSLPNQSAAPGSSIVFPMVFSLEASSVSGVQFDLEYDSSAMSLAMTAGDVLSTAGKKIYTVDLASNKKRLILVGPNQNPIAPGTLINLFVNLNQNVPFGAYSLRFSGVAGAGPNGVPVPITSVDGSITIQSTSSIVRLQPNGVLNGASFQSGPVAPGEIVTLIGSGIGPVSAQEPSTSPSTTLAGSEVLFDGIRAPLLFAAQNQINAVVPYGTSGKAKTQLEVNLQGQRIAGTQVSVAPTAPAIFTLDSSGAGQGAILNQDSTMNSPANPARKGSVVALFGTGAGQTDPGGLDGQITGAVLPKPLVPVYAYIAGFAAEVQYAGAAPGLIAGVIQVNVLIPAEAPSGEAVPITLTIGQRESGSGVTLAIK
jgi:uncharacterized protein (TIGR03437 family)